MGLGEWLAAGGLGKANDSRCGCVCVCVCASCTAVRSYNLVTMDTCLYGANASTAAPVVFRQHTCASTASRLPNSDCVLSQWSYWSRCSAECSGTTTRTRLVALPATGTGSCPSVPLSETQSCSAPCPYVVGTVAVALWLLLSLSLWLCLRACLLLWLWLWLSLSLCGCGS